MARVFISHASKDAEQARRLLKWLRSRGFDGAFLDLDHYAGIPPGADWERTLYREIARADAVLLVFTANWMASKWCFAEFTQARALGKAIFPLIERPAGDTYVAPDIQHLDLRQDREGKLEQLAARLTEIALNARGGFDWDRARPPFPGLLAYDEADAAIYFGRDDDIRRLIERLNARRAQGGANMLALLGASGSGKSSLIRAGVLPRLKRDKRNWIVLPPFRPQKHPLEELAQALAQALGGAGDWREVCAKLGSPSREQSLRELARDLRAAQSANDARILVSIDQGEESFGTTQADEATEFWKVLNAMLAEHSPFLVLLGLRSDYLGQLQQAPGLSAPFEEFSLKPLPLERVREIAEGPARLAGLSMDNALIAAAMQDAATDDALPLLAFALRELYDRFGYSGALTLAGYRALGDEKANLSPLENAVRRKADEVLAEAKPTEDELRALKDAFVPAMVRLNPAAEGELAYVRQPAGLDALPTKARPLIERLVNARLLTRRQESAASVVEVAHEALLRKWPLLRAWIDEEREFLIGKQQLERDLRDWQEAADAQKSDALLSGLKLMRARTWLVGQPHMLSEAERKFIDASIARQEAETARRERARRIITAGSLAASFVLLLAAGAAVWQWRAAVRSEQAAVKSQHAAEISERQARRSEQAAEEQKREAKEQRDTALMTQSRYLADRADKLITEGDATSTILLGLAALPDTDGRVERPYVAEAEAALFTARYSRQELAVLAGHEGWVWSAVFSPDGRHILTASEDRTAQLWNPVNAEQLGKFEGHDKAVQRASFGRDGQIVLTAAGDGTARIWDVATRGVIAVLAGHTGYVTSASASPDGKLALTSSSDGTARIWNCRTGEPIAVLKGHEGSLLGAAFNPDGQRVVTASTDKSARLWDKDGHEIAAFKGHEEWVMDAQFSPDGRRVVTASKDRTARIWDVESRQTIAVLAGHNGAVMTATFSPNGKRVLTASEDATARIWDAASGEEITALRGGYDNRLLGAAFSPDGSQVLTASDDETARLWDLTTHQEAAVLRGHTGAVLAAAINLDGKKILTASADTRARLWDDKYRIIGDLVGHENWIWAAAFSPDGRLAATGSTDSTARLWDVETRRQVGLLSVHDDDNVLGLAFSPDGRLLATAHSDKTARLWNVETMQEVGVLSGHRSWVRSVAFSPDGKRVLTGSHDETARLWDLETKQEIGIFKGHYSQVLKAVFSPDGRLVATASEESRVRIWDAETRQQLRAFGDHKDAIWSLAFSPDGRHLVTVSVDKTVWLWDVDTGQNLGVIRGHNNRMWDARFSLDGRHLITASSDATARVWEMFATTQDLVEDAKHNVPRCLTPAQREKLFLDREPPAWCIELKKWPYQGQDWKDWLKYIQSGTAAPLPDTPEWPAWVASRNSGQKP